MSAAELQELGLTPEQLAERRQKVSEMLRKNEPKPQEQKAVESAWAKGVQTNKEAYQESYKPTRAPRSDKGKKRKAEPAPEPQKAGAITKEQANELHARVHALNVSKAAYENSYAAWLKCQDDFTAFVDSLTKG